MKERPILFSGAMVRALLDGRKTQTRRAIKPQPASGAHWSQIVVDGHGGWIDGHGKPLQCPYGQPGDRLWVRETWQGPLVDEDEMQRDPTRAKDLSVYRDSKHCAYRASGDSCEFFDAAEDEVVARWKPSIHMPRWASRILLEVTDVRVERLQEISENDSKAEGLMPAPGGWWSGADGQSSPTPTGAYALLWESINGTGSWAANPWVWVVEFRVIEPSEVAA